MPCAEYRGQRVETRYHFIGITVQVPLFIKKDGVIKISTSDRSYLGRV